VASLRPITASIAEAPSSGWSRRSRHNVTRRSCGGLLYGRSRFMLSRVIGWHCCSRRRSASQRMMAPANAARTPWTVIHRRTASLALHRRALCGSATACQAIDFGLARRTIDTSTALAAVRSNKVYLPRTVGA
jgi:hypothetical protein